MYWARGYRSTKIQIELHTSLRFCGTIVMARNKRNKTKGAIHSEDHANDGPVNGFNISSTLENIRTYEASNPAKRQRDDADSLTTENDYTKRVKLDQSPPSLTFSGIHKLQASIKLGDLQQLLLYCLADGNGPQWVAVGNPKAIKKAVLLHCPGLDRDAFPVWKAQSKDQDGFIAVSSNASPDEYLPSPLISANLAKELEPLTRLFQHVWPVRAHGDSKYGKVHSPLHSILTVCLPKSQESKSNGPSANSRQQDNTPDQPTSVTDYLATKEELQSSDFPMHTSFFSDGETKPPVIKGWINTSATSIARTMTIISLSSENPDLTAGYQILALDCEMCQSAISISELTRISLVSWSGTTVLDSLVKPPNPITDYLTPYSGITAEMLAPVTTTLQDIQNQLLNLLTPETILVGHSLESDLKALQLTHPLIVDTSILFPHPRGAPLKSSLKYLAQRHLGREIQKGHGLNGHDSVEDALACLDLVKQKCIKGPLWGATDADRESIFRRIVRANPGDPITLDTCGAIVDTEDHVGAYGGMGAKVLARKGGDDDVIAGVKEAVNGESAIVPSGGYRLTHATLRQTTTEGNVKGIEKIHTSLPPHTLFIVYSGIGSLSELRRLQSIKRAFQEEFKTKKWDELSVQWTDREDQAVRRAADEARKGVGFLCVK